MHNVTNEADTMSFEEMLACPHLQFSLDTEILPHMLAFGPPAAPATERRRWMFSPVRDTTDAGEVELFYVVLAGLLVFRPARGARRLLMWRDKDDPDLTSEDIDAMIDEGEPVAVRGPRLPGGAVLIEAAATWGGGTVHAESPPQRRLLACPACGYGCGCCCHCDCQTPCPTPDEDGDCDCPATCHGGHPQQECHLWAARLAAIRASA